MKRSEVVDEIAMIVMDMAEDNTSDDIAESIMKKIEELGMMPPRSGTDEIYTGDDEILIPEYEWDRE